MHRVYNFSPGPAMLPDEVLQQAQAEILDWQESGMSVMEISHRSESFQRIANQSEADLRELLAIPSNYHVLFVPGGASFQFSLVPMNLFSDAPHSHHADYMDTGIWSVKAIEEAERYGQISIVTRRETVHGKTCIPSPRKWKLNPEAVYLHYTPNETIDGVEFRAIPETGNVPLVADMTSCILSEPIDVSRYGIIYAGAQKNLGQAGITVVIIRNDLLKKPVHNTPTLCSYEVQARYKSFYNTPPTYAWYMLGLILAHAKKQGGTKAYAAAAKRKSDKLYAFIDSHEGFYGNSVDPSCRSRMNVPFSLAAENLTGKFLEEAEAAGLCNLRGHRLAGGLRASIYNAMPEAGVDALLDFMDDFAKQNA